MPLRLWLQFPSNPAIGHWSLCGQLFLFPNRPIDVEISGSAYSVAGFSASSFVLFVGAKVGLVLQCVLVLFGTFSVCVEKKRVSGCECVLYFLDLH